MPLTLLRVRMSLRRSRRNSSSGAAAVAVNVGGSVLLPNGERAYKPLNYTENLTVKDVIDGACEYAGLLPVTWPFFGLCPADKELFLFPYRLLTPEDCMKEYRLRVIAFVNPNCFHLKFLDDGALHLFFDQVREDFFLDQLGTIATDHMLWMAGVNMARIAIEEATDYKGLLLKHSYKEFFPVNCLKKATQLRKVVVAAFNKFYASSSPAANDKLKLKFLEIAEKSASIFHHRTFNGFVQSNHRTLPVTLSLSAKCIDMKGHLPTSEPETICLLQDISFIECNSNSFIAKIVSVTEGQQEQMVIFPSVEEMIHFAVTADTLHGLVVDCNKCILDGSLKTPERYLKITEKDPINEQLCHGPISRAAVLTLLHKAGLEDGLYLVRRSRQRVHSYTLHICYQRKIRNFEIKHDSNGLYILPAHSFDSMLRLVYYYHKHQHGLPVILKKILPPHKTGPMPLLDRDPRAPGDSKLVEDSSLPASTSEDISTSGGSDSSVSCNDTFFLDHISQPSTPNGLTDDGFSELPSPFAAGLQKFGQMEQLGPMEIPFSWLHTGPKLGQGHFSNVYRGVLIDGNTRKRQEVAIKVLKKQAVAESGDTAKVELLKEASSMANLSHPHIVRFIGISSNETDEMLITEFVRLGDLRSYLKKFAARPESVELDKLIKFCTQIADGMSYLQEQKIVHRDLAARNVLVENESLVKISDFGLARQLNLQKNSEYYRVDTSKNVALPIWWYAPEAMFHWKFTSANDVWSFGVTMWEIFTLGSTPKLDTQICDRMSIYVYLTSGKRLEKPSLCPDDVYKIMLDKCWNIEPQLRGKFVDLSRKLQFIVT